MKKFIFPVILLIGILLVIFASDFNKWPKTVNTTLTVVTKSVQEFLPEETATKAVTFVQQFLSEEAVTKTVEFVQEYLPEEAETEAVALLDSPQPFRVRVRIGKVTSIVDGDTIELQAASGRKYRVRLIEIDTPEDDQPWGSEGKKALSNKILQKRVEIYDQGTDRYGRKIGRVYFEDRDISRELIAEGHAWVNREYKPDSSLVDAEESARSNRLGLWSLDNPIPPWTWKRGAITDNNPGSLNSECGVKFHCQEMTSCREAMFYLRECGLSELDDDSDGIPCESVCVR